MDRPLSPLRSRDETGEQLYGFPLLGMYLAESRLGQATFSTLHTTKAALSRVPREIGRLRWSAQLSPLSQILLG